MSLNSSSTDSCEETRGGALFVPDEDGVLVEVLQGDLVRDTGGTSRMVVVRVDSQQCRVVLRGERECSPDGEEQSVVGLMLLREGVTLARHQLRELLAIYFAHCTREECAPHEGLVQGIEHSIRTATAKEVSLDLSGRRLRDAELFMLNAATLHWHATRCSLSSAELTASQSPSAAACCVRVVDVSQNKISCDGATALCTMLARDMPLVLELYLDSNNISDGFQNILSSSSSSSSCSFPATHGLNHLKILTACNNKICNLRALPHFPSLHTLFLDRNPLGLGLDSSALHNSTQLTSLSLSSATLNNLSRTCATLSILSNLRSLVLQPSPRARVGARTGTVLSSRARIAVAVAADASAAAGSSGGSSVCSSGGGGGGGGSGGGRLRTVPRNSSSRS